MMKFRIALLLSCVFFVSGPALAAGSQRIDPLLEKAILDSAQLNPAPITSDALAVEAAQGEDIEAAAAEDASEEMIVDEIEAAPPEEESVDSASADTGETGLPEEEATAQETAMPESAEPEYEEETETEETEVAETEKPVKMPGFKVGMFKLLPVITLEEEYNNNVLAAPTGAQSDFITKVTPQLRAEFQENGYELVLDTGYHGELYNDRPGENVHDWHAEAAGRIESTESLSFPFGIGFAIDHEKREDDLTRQLPRDRTRRSDFSMMAGAIWKPGKPSLSLIGNFLRERYEDGRAMTGGAPVVRSDADRATREYKARLDYDYDQDRRFFAQALTAGREYENRNFQGGGFNGPYRDSNWYELRAGMFLKMVNLITDVSFGYKNWDHDDNAVNEHMAEFVADVDISLELSEQTLITLAVHRDLYEDDEVMSLIRRTSAEAGIRRYFGEDFSMAFAGTFDEQKHVSTPREDNTFGFHINADYRIDPRFTAGLEYRVDSRASKPPGGAFEFDRQIVTARVRGDL